jgi:hypothetical protein
MAMCRNGLQPKVLSFFYFHHQEETIFQFTKDNSPLPSNAVNDIAVMRLQARYILQRTIKCIVSFQGDHTSSNLENVFAFLTRKTRF